jgi:hypothetical protein
MTNQHSETIAIRGAEQAAARIPPRFISDLLECKVNNETGMGWQTMDYCCADMNALNTLGSPSVEPAGACNIISAFRPTDHRAHPR